MDNKNRQLAELQICEEEERTRRVAITAAQNQLFASTQSEYRRTMEIALVHLGSSGTLDSHSAVTYSPIQPTPTKSGNTKGVPRTPQPNGSPTDALVGLSGSCQQRRPRDLVKQLQHQDGYDSVLSATYSSDDGTPKADTKHTVTTTVELRGQNVEASGDNVPRQPKMASRSTAIVSTTKATKETSTSDVNSDMKTHGKPPRTNEAIKSSNNNNDSSAYETPPMYNFSGEETKRSAPNRYVKTNEDMEFDFLKEVAEKREGRKAKERAKVMATKTAGNLSSSADHGSEIAKDTMRTTTEGETITHPASTSHSQKTTLASRLATSKSERVLSALFPEEKHPAGDAAGGGVTNPCKRPQLWEARCRPSATMIPSKPLSGVSSPRAGARRDQRTRMTPATPQSQTARTPRAPPLVPSSPISKRAGWGVAPPSREVSRTLRPEPEKAKHNPMQLARPFNALTGAENRFGLSQVRPPRTPDSSNAATTGQSEEAVEDQVLMAPNHSTTVQAWLQGFDASPAQSSIKTPTGVGVDSDGKTPRKDRARDSSDQTQPDVQEEAASASTPRAAERRRAHHVVLLSDDDNDDDGDNAAWAQPAVGNGFDDCTHTGGGRGGRFSISKQAAVAIARETPKEKKRSSLALAERKRRKEVQAQKRKEAQLAHFLGIVDERVKAMEALSEQREGAAGAPPGLVPLSLHDVTTTAVAASEESPGASPLKEGSSLPGNTPLTPTPPDVEGQTYHGATPGIAKAIKELTQTQLPQIHPMARPVIPPKLRQEAVPTRWMKTNLMNDVKRRWTESRGGGSRAKRKRAGCGDASPRASQLVSVCDDETAEVVRLMMAMQTDV